MHTKVYKAAMASNIVGFSAFICSIIVSGVKAIISGGSSLDVISLAVLFFLAMLVLDFLALKERKWRNWSIASIGIKATILLIYLPQVVYSIGRLFEYGYRYYYLSPVLFVLYLILVSFPSVYNIKTLGKEKSHGGSSNLDPVSIGVVSVGLFLTIIFFISGVSSIGASGWAALGVLFIAPSFLAILLLVFDFLALKDRKWFAWSIVSLVVKGLCAIPVLQCIAYELGQMLRGNSYSNLLFYTMLFVFVVLIAYPSVRNIVNIRKQ